MMSAMMHRSVVMSGLAAGLLLLPALVQAQSLGNALQRSAAGIADQAKDDAEAQAKDAAKGAARDAVGDTGDSRLKAAAEEGVDKGSKAMADGADLETAGKKGAAAAANKALGLDQPAKGRVTNMTAEGATDAE